MAASRMSRIHRLALLLTVALAVVAHTLAQTDDSEVSSEIASDTESPFDLKKQSQKKYNKNVRESEWSYRGEVKKSDGFKDPKDVRLLRLISEGLLNPQDTLPIVSNDAIISSQINNSSKDISVNVQPEGMSGIVNDGISVDSDERIIMEKKKNATKEKFSKIDSEASRESDEDIKVNLDANVGVQVPSFNKQKGSISVPAQKHISLSKGKDNIHKKEVISYEVLSLKPSKEKPTDEGVFDFVDSPLSDKHLVPAGTAQTSRINVKKGPNGQDYEYEYIYYYYEDEGETSAQDAAPSAKGNEIPVSPVTPTQRTTTSIQRVSSSTPKYTKTFSEDGLGTRVKSSEVLHEEVSLPAQTNREKFRYSIDNSNVLSQPQPVSSVPSKSSFTNDVFYSSQFNSGNGRFPSRQPVSPSVSEQPIPSVTQQVVSTTARPISRGRSHYNPTTEEDSDVFAVTPQPVPVQTREPQARTKPSGFRQSSVETLDSNVFRPHSTSIPNDYDRTFTQFESQPKGKSLKQNYDLGITQNQPTSASSTKSSDLYQKDHVVEYIEDTSRATVPTPTKSSFASSTQVTETIVDNTAPFSTLSDNSLTTVYGAGLTDKAAHDLYAIYQTQNEESKSFPEDVRTTVIDDSENTYFATNVPTTLIFSTSTTTTTTTTTTTPPPTTTSTAAPIASSPATGRGRFRGNTISRTRGFSSTTEHVASASEASPASESTEKSRTKFQPANRREPGHRVSAYGRKSTTTSAPDQDSSTASSKNQESSRPSFVPSTRTRFRAGNARTESGLSTESQSTASPGHLRPNFADRYNNRRRTNGLKSTTTTEAPGDEDAAVKQENSSPEPNAQESQSTTFRSTRMKFSNQNSQIRPLRPGPKLNLSSRSKQSTTTTTTTASNIPLDADTSGSADVPVEQKQIEENVDQEESAREAVVTTISTTTTTTPTPDALTRLKNRPKLRITDKGAHAKAQAQQANNTAALNQNRRQLVNNLLPRKKQPTHVEEPKEEKHEVSKPVEEVVDESSPKLDNEASDVSSVPEVSSTTESKLSSIIASRRRNLSARKPGTLAQSNRQTASEES